MATSSITANFLQSVGGKRARMAREARLRFLTHRRFFAIMFPNRERVKARRAGNG